MHSRASALATTSRAPYIEPAAGGAQRSAAGRGCYASTQANRLRPHSYGRNLCHITNARCPGTRCWGFAGALHRCNVCLNLSTSLHIIQGISQYTFTDGLPDSTPVASRHTRMGPSQAAGRTSSKHLVLLVIYLHQTVVHQTINKAPTRGVQAVDDWPQLRRRPDLCAFQCYN